MRSNLLGQAAVSAKNNMFGVAGLNGPEVRGFKRGLTSDPVI